MMPPGPDRLAVRARRAELSGQVWPARAVT